MSANTSIAWTDHTFNPWWGCERVSPGCDNCYAETFAKRTGHDVWGHGAAHRFFGDKHWAEPLKWEGRVFCASMADVFQRAEGLDEHRVRLWELIDNTPQLTWQLLTKRPENVPSMVPWHWMEGGWPATVWIGTTAEDQARANFRVPRLIQVPAPVRFLSCEPLIGPVRLDDWIHPREHLHDGRWHDDCGCCIRRRVQGGTGNAVEWVIVGGESGPRHRALDLDHARTIRNLCTRGGVPFFFKQIGGRTPKAGGNELDGRTWTEFPEVVCA